MFCMCIVFPQPPRTKEQIEEYWAGWADTHEAIKIANEFGFDGPVRKLLNGEPICDSDGVAI